MGHWQRRNIHPAGIADFSGSGEKAGYTVGVIDAAAEGRRSRALERTEPFQPKRLHYHDDTPLCLPIDLPAARIAGRISLPRLADLMPLPFQKRRCRCALRSISLR